MRMTNAEREIIFSGDYIGYVAVCSPVDEGDETFGNVILKKGLIGPLAVQVHSDNVNAVIVTSPVNIPSGSRVSEKFTIDTSESAGTGVLLVEITAKETSSGREFKKRVLRIRHKPLIQLIQSQIGSVAVNSPVIKATSTSAFVKVASPGTGATATLTSANSEIATVDEPNRKNVPSYTPVEFPITAGSTTGQTQISGVDNTGSSIPTGGVEPNLEVVE